MALPCWLDASNPRWSRFSVSACDLGLALKPSHVVVEVDEGRSRVAVVSGSATRSDGTGQSTIAAGEWAPGSSRSPMPSCAGQPRMDAGCPAKASTPETAAASRSPLPSVATLGVDFETGRMTGGRATNRGGEIIALSGALQTGLHHHFRWAGTHPVDGSAIGPLVTSAPSSIRSAGG